ncbi:putative phage abortive infection protein [Ursidibacter sp. B-7004-1]
MEGMAVYSIILGGGARFLPKRYSDKIIFLAYKDYLKTVDCIIGKVSAKKLQELLRHLPNIEKINIVAKADIVQLINAVRTVLSLVEKNSSKWRKCLFNNDEYIVGLLRSKLSNEWLWIIAIYLLQKEQSECKRLVIKYRLLEHIQHLNEYSLDEVAAFPNEANELYLASGEHTPKGNFFLHQNEISQLLNHIRLEFLPQE